MTMHGGGKPLEWMQPLRPNGQRHEDRVGTYAQHFDHWNITPESGFEYRIAHDRRGRVGQLVRMGYEVCDAPSKGAFGENPSLHHGRSPDSVQRDGDMVLMRIPVPLYAKRSAEKAAKAKAQLTGTPFLTGSRPGEESKDDRPIRFKIPGHGIDMKQGGA